MTSTPGIRSNKCIELEKYTHFQIEPDDFYYKNRQWEIIGPVEATLENTFYEGWPEPYQDITYVFKFQRNSLGAAVMVRLPISGEAISFI